MLWGAEYAAAYQDARLAGLLYADDAALPADSPEDLQLSAQIFEEFCNTHRLFIATPKTFVTVSHPKNDQGVIYHDDGVTVDGDAVEVKAGEVALQVDGGKQTRFDEPERTDGGQPLKGEKDRKW